MLDINIGSLAKEAGIKDALHFPVVSVKSSDRFLPGEPVGLNDKGLAAQVDDPIGIVDPFLKRAVEPGDTFWLMLYQKTVTNLRHDWSHPAFEKIDGKVESEKWLREFAEDTGWSYEEVIEKVTEAFTGGSAYGGDDDTADKFNDKKRLLQQHVSVVTGKTFTEKSVDAAYFGCAC